MGARAIVVTDAASLRGTSCCDGSLSRIVTTKTHSLAGGVPDTPGATQVRAHSATKTRLLG